MPDNFDGVVGGPGGSDLVDVDNDDALDLVLFDHFICTFQVFRGTGTGTFVSPPLVSPVGPGSCGEAQVNENGRRTRSGAFLDVDGDGKLDAVLPNNGAKQLLVFRQQAGTFVAAAPIPMPNDCVPTQVVAADLGSTADNELIVACGFNQTGDQRTVVVEHSDVLFVPHLITPDIPLTDFVVLDVDRDGRLDLVATGENGFGKGVRVFHNDNNFAFSSSIINDLVGGRIAATNAGDGQLGIGVIGGTAFQRATFGNRGSSLQLSSSTGPVVTRYAAPGFVEADNFPGVDYIAAADGNLYIELATACDDGNNVDGDGCSSLCVTE